MSENANQYQWKFYGGVLLKALVLLIIVSFFFAFFYPFESIGKVSAYNIIFPGRTRLPYGDDPSKSYNLSLFNLAAMFASHQIDASTKPDTEFRVILIGDSSTWGYLLPPDDTLAEQLNRKRMKLKDGRELKFYNLGYPVMSLTKDLVILSEAMDYQPDLVIWLVTLESFPNDKQLYPALLQQNPNKIRTLIHDYILDLNSEDPALIDGNISLRSLVAARRELADLVRLQLYGVLWSATGIDHFIPEIFPAKQEDMAADMEFHVWETPPLDPSMLAFDFLRAGQEVASTIPIWVINEPIFISSGENSDIRYNFYYPRWAYDEYRQLMQAQSENSAWLYSDFWNVVPPDEFTNTAVHLSPYGTSILAEVISRSLPKILYQDE